tara:strand:+ start:447 stop:860 length:414 start_codon:yes stop_codon:yes gene_type:complete
MNYRELKWGALKSYGTKLGINTKGMTKEVLLEWLDAMPDVAHGIEELKPFTGIKQHHPLFDEIKDYLPYLKAFKKLKAVSPVPEVNKAIATLFMKYIEEQKNIRINLGCGRCKHSYYERMIAGYNKLVDEYGGGERI